MAVPISSLLRSSSTGPITLAQFTDVLQRTWADSRRFRPGTAAVLPSRLGLAVSGGADSMALAYLCREWEKQHQSQSHTTSLRNIDERRSSGDDAGTDVSVTAFIVDHKARSESTQEAHTVASWLQSLGLRTAILSLTWPEESLTSRAFETHARRLRYRALGEACRERGIEALLMGHHQDDNVETTIWRLASGARGAAGLTGIPGFARIPECHGLWGVAESGKGVSVSSQDFVLDYASKQQHHQQEGQIQVATGGIYISRPFLSFRKSSLVATCRENGVPFVDDPTNFDPTLTPRNAIRSILSNHSLPRALTNPSILAHIERAQGKVKESYQLSDEALEKECKLLDFNFRSGTMTVQFCSSALISSPAEVQGIEEKRKEQEQATHHPKEIHALTLRRITEFISPFPENHWPLSGFAPFTDRVFPPPLPPPSGLPEPDIESTLRSDTARKAFTVGGVLFQPLPYSSSPSPTLKRKTERTKIKTETTPNNGPSTWLLTRQPYFRNKAPILHLNLLLSTQLNGEPTYTPWMLWDNRFWIRAAAVSIRSHLEPNQDQSHEMEIKIPIVIRPLHQSDLSLIRQVAAAQKRARAEMIAPLLRQEDGGTLDSHRAPGVKQSDDTEFNAGAFLAKISAEAPGQSRLAVPVLALEGENGNQSRALAIPTMGLVFPDRGLEPTGWAIRWEWKYKMIDLDSLRLVGFV
ncbi:PP-loop family-domain-containing protein [Aspergillus heterothallicus]